MSRIWYRNAKTRTIFWIIQFAYGIPLSLLLGLLSSAVSPFFALGHHCSVVARFQSPQSTKCPLTCALVGYPSLIKGYVVFIQMWNPRAIPSLRSTHNSIVISLIWVLALIWTERRRETFLMTNHCPF